MQVYTNTGLTTTPSGGLRAHHATRRARTPGVAHQDSPNPKCFCIFTSMAPNIPRTSSKGIHSTIDPLDDTNIDTCWAFRQPHKCVCTKTFMGYMHHRDVHFYSPISTIIATTRTPIPQMPNAMVLMTSITGCGSGSGGGAAAGSSIRITEMGRQTIE